MRLRHIPRRHIQLDLFVAGGISPLDAGQMLSELRSRGAAHLRDVRLRSNRLRLLSLSHDGRTLNLHECFAAAPPPILDAIARFVAAERGSRELHDAVRHLRDWPGAQEGLRAARGARAPTAPCCGTPAQQRFLRELYAHLNRSRFAAALPERLTLRLSDRMSCRFGHVTYERSAEGERHVVELALNVQLLAAGNDGLLIDTMLHEMAHVEAWLQRGHRHHGATWKRVCLRVGCIPRACTRVRLRRRPRPILRVPPLPPAAFATN